MIFYLLVAAIVVQSIVSLVAYAMTRAVKASSKGMLSCTICFKHADIAVKACGKIRKFFFANRDIYLLKKLCTECKDGKYAVVVQYSILSKYAKHIDFDVVLATLLKDDEDDV